MSRGTTRNPKDGQPRQPQVQYPQVHDFGMNWTLRHNLFRRKAWSRHATIPLCARDGWEFQSGWTIRPPLVNTARFENAVLPVQNLLMLLSSFGATKSPKAGTYLRKEVGRILVERRQASSTVRGETQWRRWHSASTHDTFPTGATMGK